MTGQASRTPRHRWRRIPPVVLAGVSALALLAGCATASAPEGAAGDPALDTVVRTDGGAVRGTADAASVRFLGMPYAAAPVGDRRWTAPAAAPRWSGIRDATHYRAACLQQPGVLLPGEKMSEDCLYLNVTGPRQRSPRPRPVFVWLHGGGGVQGSGGPGYDARRLAERGDMLVVTLNYRLGVWGNLALPQLGTGAGFETQDQQAALRWVQRNIRAFGGDPGNVTLGGESNGALSTCTQLNSPTAEGLFRRAILMSGSCGTKYATGTFGAGVPGGTVWHDRTSLEKDWQRAAASVGCARPESVLTCLRALPAKKLLVITAASSQKPIGTRVLPHDPHTQLRAPWARHLPVLAGSLPEENLYFFGISGVQPKTPADYRRMLRASFGADAARIERTYPAGRYRQPILAAAAAYSDHDWTCPTVRTNRIAARTAPTWTYLFADPNAPSFDGQPVARPSTPHGSDVIYLFDVPGYDPLNTKQRALAERLQGYWAAFIRSGDPNHTGATRWPRTTTSSNPAALRLTPDTDTRISIAQERHCALWNTVRG